jgi:hypothetical protein
MWSEDQVIIYVSTVGQPVAHGKEFYRIACIKILKKLSFSSNYLEGMH